MLYKVNEGRYDAIRWDGTNQQAVQDFVLRYSRTPDWSWQVFGPDAGPQEGALFGTAAYDSVILQRGECLVLGPFWGGEEPGSIPRDVIPATVFAVKFTATT